MPKISAAKENQRVALEVQTKFEFWLLGLIFAVLALAVQTASFDGPGISRGCELLAWIDLLLAGLIAMSRLEWTPVLYKLSSEQYRRRAGLEEFEKMERQGARAYTEEASGTRRVNIKQELIEPREGELARLGKSIEALEKKHARKYKLLRVLLILGFSLLLVARGYSPTVQLWDDFSQPGSQVLDRDPSPSDSRAHQSEATEPNASLQEATERREPGAADVD